MTLVQSESYDGVETPAQLFGDASLSDVSKLWSVRNAATLAHISFTAGPWTGRMRRVTVVQNVQHGSPWDAGVLAQAINVPTPISELYVGRRYRTNRLPNVAVNGIVADAPIYLSVFDAVTSTGTSKRGLAVGVESDGKVSLYRLSGTGSTVTLLGTSANALIAVDTEYYIELRAQHSATGLVSVRINEIAIPELTGTFDTKGAMTETTYASVGCGYNPTNVAPGRTIDADDWYICNASGAKNNTFLGVARVVCTVPVSSGSSSQFLGSDGNSVNNYQLVDERDINDADYVQSGTVGDLDLYNHGAVGLTSPTVAGVVRKIRAAKTGGAFDLKASSKLGASSVDSAVVGLTTGLKHYTVVFENDPAGAAWTVANVDATERGFKVA